MGKFRPEEQHFDLRVKSSGKGEQRLRVVEIRYVPTPDAEERLSRIIDILLKAAARDTTQAEASTDTKKKEEDGPGRGE
jgi:hypothetical protein